MISHPADGFLRLSLDAMLSTRLHHLISGVDECRGSATGACGHVTDITGYTEWVSRTVPVVTLGWDWCMAAGAAEVRCVRVGLPRTNVLLIDEFAHDLDPNKSLEILATVVDAMSWNEPTRRAIVARYGRTYQRW